MAKRKPLDNVQLKLRMKESLRAQIERDAARHDRSMNNEIIDKLERSFDAQKLLPQVLELAYGPKLAGIVQALIEAMSQTGRQVGFDATRSLEGSEHWWLNPAAFDQAAKAANHVLEAFRPHGEIVPGPLQKSMIASGVEPGHGYAGSLLRVIAIGGTEPEEAWAAPIRKQLGQLAVMPPTDDVIIRTAIQPRALRQKKRDDK